MNRVNGQTTIPRSENLVEGSFWDRLVELGGPIKAVIDPNDRRGFKNLYIDTLQKMVLNDVLDIKDAVVLDFGCGSGRFLSLTVGLAKYVVGVEISQQMLAYARQRALHGQRDFVLFDGRRLPFIENCFDAVLSVGSIQNLKDDAHFECMVAQIVQCVRKGGKIYLLEQARNQRGAWQRTADDYRSAFGRCGCSCIQSYPVRNGRSVLLYAIRYGLIPGRWASMLARREIRNTRQRRPAPWVPYQDHLFVFSKR
jgi:SAM-dependent methyltransferase